MLKFELLRDRGILIVTPNGPLEKADFERLAKEVDPFIASKGKLTGLLIYTESFPVWDPVPFTEGRLFNLPKGPKAFACRFLWGPTLHHIRKLVKSA